MWEMGLLGDASPQSLLDTMVFYNGFYFALRSGQEHRQLRRDTPQIELVERPGEHVYLKYTEDISKNRPGGLKGRKASPKFVIHHANTEVPERCFVRLYKLYMEKCPSDAPGHSFYLRPSTLTSECWYYRFPLGHTTLSKTVSRLCQLCGIQGFKTYHSLRATATTRPYQSGVDEQLVMERTGHRSLEGLRSYNRTCNTQREALSNILNQSKDLCPVTNSLPSLPKTPTTSTPHHIASASTMLTASQHQQQLVSGLSLQSATLQHCTVNFYTGSAAPTESRNTPATIRKRSVHTYIIHSGRRSLYRARAAWHFALGTLDWSLYNSRSHACRFSAQAQILDRRLHLQWRSTRSPSHCLSSGSGPPQHRTHAVPATISK